MIERALKPKLLTLSEQYPIVTLTGSRQSGKSTLLKNTFPNYQYVSLEDPDVRDFAQNDPRGFLKTYSSRAVLDKFVQR
ncbi:MAG TPA: AAA family ATPase [Candidatus Aphodousia gallistercoris]|nr:AAA family ATPase [Candidatus Aphodousia gallistercoris]